MRGMVITMARKMHRETWDHNRRRCNVSTPGLDSDSKDKAISSLVDMRVLLPGGGILGSVDELLVDIRSGRISYVVARCPDGRRKTISWDRVKCQGGNLQMRDCTREAP